MTGGTGIGLLGDRGGGHKDLIVIQFLDLIVRPRSICRPMLQESRPITRPTSTHQGRIQKG